MRTYEDAQAYLAKGRSKTRRPLPGRSTYIREAEDGRIEVVYHETAVVAYHPDGRVVLDSGGWRTVTTKDRMCTYSPATIHQAKGVWYIKTTPNGSAVDWKEWHADPGFVYADGVTVLPNGRIEGAEPAESAKAIEKERAAVRKYCKGFANRFFEGQVPAPSNGDCWFCLMHTQNGESLGDAFNNADHIKSHIKEGYFVPSLLHDVLKERFRPDHPWISLALAAAWGEPEALKEHYPDKTPKEVLQSVEFYKTDIVRALTRYVFKRLGMVFY